MKNGLYQPEDVNFSEDIIESWRKAFRFNSREEVIQLIVEVNNLWIAAVKEHGKIDLLITYAFNGVLAQLYYETKPQMEFWEFLKMILVPTGDGEYCKMPDVEGYERGV